jgi:phage internal scaffolding protein
MGFYRYDEEGKVVRKRVILKCNFKDDLLTEQSHKDEVNINNIIKRHGTDMIRKTALLKSQEYVFDDVTGNDFQEAMFKVNKAQESFDSLPSEVRKKFDNNPAKFMDFVQNPDNADSMVELGLAERIPETPPVQVEVVSPPSETTETPPA